MRARYYNPVVKRFLSGDTYLGRVTDTQSQNRYAFCENDPVNKVDPTGHDVGGDLYYLDQGSVDIPEFNINWELYEELYQQGRYDEIPEPVLNEIGGLQPDPIGEFLFIDLPSGSLTGLARGFNKALITNELGAVRFSISKSSSLILGNKMIEAGIVRPSFRHAAHHIIAGNSPKAEQARLVLQKFDIGINDAINGVFLPTERNVSNSIYHPCLHTREYYDKINEILLGAKNKKEVEEALRDIADRLSKGVFMK
jgi:hypothetical protein